MMAVFSEHFSFCNSAVRNDLKKVQRERCQLFHNLHDFFFPNDWYVNLDFEMNLDRLLTHSTMNRNFILIVSKWHLRRVSMPILVLCLKCRLN